MVLPTISTFKNSGNIGAKQHANIGNEHSLAVLSRSQSKADTSSTVDELEASCHHARGDTITSSIVKEQSKPHAKQLSNITPTMSIPPRVHNLFGM
jgi:hypothetical protein